MNEFTNEQLSAVNRINQCTNYYDILSVEHDANDITIKKSYKRLALLLHPDKNKAPGAIDAFKKLGNAASILTDERKRYEYDMYGSTTSNVESSSGQGWYEENANDMNMFHGMRFQSAEISPEEFFNIFFNSNFNMFEPFNQTRQTANLYGESDDEQDEIPSPSTENHRTINERSLFRKILDLLFIFIVTWIVNSLMRSPRRN